MWRCLLALTLAVAQAGELPALPIATADWPPYITANKPQDGLLSGLTERVAARMGMRVEWHMLSWPLVERMVQDGKVFAGLPYVKTAERQQRFDYSIPLVSMPSVLFCLRGSLASRTQMQTLADLAGFRVAGPHGYWWESELLHQGAKLRYTSDEAAAFKLLALGRVDFVPQDELVGLALVRSQHPELKGRIEALPMLGSENEPLHFILSRRYSDTHHLRERFAAALDAELQSGKLAEAVDAYRRDVMARH
jgi:polar amino acid transport system substrate-binding protein